jgi:hypothetical protein
MTTAIALPVGPATIAVATATAAEVRPSCEAIEQLLEDHVACQAAFIAKKRAELQAARQRSAGWIGHNTGQTQAWRDQQRQGVESDFRRMEDQIARSELRIQRAKEGNLLHHPANENGDHVYLYNQQGQAMLMAAHRLGIPVVTE